MRQLQELEPDRAPMFPIVGIGAADGGLEAFEQFIGAMPHDTGMAFVLIQHRDKDRALVRRLQACTGMPVRLVAAPTPVEPDHIYINPMGKQLSLASGRLELTELPPTDPNQPSIDLFLRALASDWGEWATAVILSGAGRDGAHGLKSIKEADGMVLVQDPDEADFDEMPRCALETGMVDLVAPAAVLASHLAGYRHIERSTPFPDTEEAEAPDRTLPEIFARLRQVTGHDFTHYKQSTTTRRIQRRRQVRQCDDLDGYLQLLREDANEAHTLARDFLISVTSFFRDPPAFKVLAEGVLPHLFANKAPDEPVRVWVPGCATGEEAYSLAILLLEEARKEPERPAFQIFATDLDENALAFARKGIYPPEIAADVKPEWLARYFQRESHGYRVKPEVQRLVLFAHHNLVKDPPFSRLHLISCRNLLIYVKREMQKRLFELFHYALRPGGYLFLGNSETADRLGDLFDVIDKDQRIYQCRPGPARLPEMMAGRTRSGALVKTIPVERPHPAASGELRDVHHSLILRHHAPPSVVIDAGYELRHLSGNVGRYLRPQDGAPSQNLLPMLPPELRLELHAIIFQVFRLRQPATSRPLRMQHDGQELSLRVRVEPVPTEMINENLALVVFEELHGLQLTNVVEESSLDDQSGQLLEQLEADLKETRHRLQTVVEEYETSNEELKASNEELQSTNEELHSTAEELRTREEELRATNKELNTVNQALRRTIEQLDQANSDLENLMMATDIATLFLSRDLNLKRYTPRATDLFKLIPSDIGRPFDHISHNLKHDALPALADRVLQSLETVETEVQSKDGQSYLMRMLPYRTVDQRIDGLVATFVDITEQVEAEEQARIWARRQAVVSELGLYALRGTALPELMDIAVRQVAQVLDVELCKVLELQADGKELLLRAGVGWQPGLVGQATVGTGTDSQAGYTLEMGRPIIVRDLRKEKRFNGPSLLLEHNVVSGMSVVIEGRQGPYGIVGAHTTAERIFTQLDTSFLQAVANVLGTAVERRRAEQERLELLTQVEAERAHLHKLFTQAPALIAIYEGPDHVYSFANELYQQVIGGRDVIGQPLQAVLSELEGQGIFEAFDQVYTTGVSVVRRELHVVIDRDLDGRLEDGYFDLVIQPVRRGDEIQGVMSLAFEVTEQVRARQEQEAERRVLQAILEQMPAGVIVAEAPSGKLLLGNRRVAKLWPYEQAKSVTEYGTLREGFKADGSHYQPEEWPLARALQHGETIHNETIQFRDNNGLSRVVSISAAPVHDDSGEMIAGVAIYEEVTERKQMEQALKHERARLKEINETLEERVEERTVQVRALASALTLAEQRERERISRILHDDLQQLLHALQMRTLIMEMETAAFRDEAVQEHLGEVESLTRRALDITRSLSVELSPPILEGEGLQAAFRWLASHMAERYGLQIHLKLAHEPAYLGKDLRELIFQLVRELLFNVVKHAGVKEAWLILDDTAEQLVIRIEDKGAGFDVPNVLRHQEPGGFGLYNVRQRLNLFRGEMDIDATPGEGTKVTIRMPRINTRDGN